MKIETQRSRSVNSLRAGAIGKQRRPSKPARERALHHAAPDRLEERRQEVRDRIALLQELVTSEDETVCWAVSKSVDPCYIAFQAQTQGKSIAEVAAEHRHMDAVMRGEAVTS
jgi:hypothetical protein